METRDLATLVLYAVGLAMAAACFALNILGSITINTLVTLLAIGVFAISVAGIRSTSARSQK